MRIARPVLFLVILTVVACSGDEDANDSEWSPPDVLDCSGGCTVVQPSAPHGVTLDAAQVVNGSIDSDRGSGELELDRESGVIRGTITLTADDIDTVTLNRGYAGEDGPILVRFDKIGDFEWSLPPAHKLSAQDVAAMDSGGLYVDATSVRSPTGGIRGQVVRGGAVKVYFYTLFGSQVAPATASTATAKAAITTSAVVDGYWAVGGYEDIVLHVNVYGLVDVRSVHVHEAFAGENGPIVVDLARDSANPDHWSSRQSLFDELAKAAFRSGYCLNGSCDPRLYVDVHTDSHPDGELRAQLGYRTEVQFAALSGDDVVPSVQSSRSGTVATTITDIVGWYWTLELTMNVNLGDIDDATAVTLNYAPVGQNGPMVYSLERDPARSNHWRGRTLLDEPAGAEAHGWYFNVTTASFPSGELRAQRSTQFNRWAPEDSFSVNTVNPADGSTIVSWPSTITVEFNRDLLATSVGPGAVGLLASGGDASFGDGNELPIMPVAVNVVGSTMTIDVGQNEQANDVYRLSINDVAAADTGQLHRFFSTFAVDNSHPSPAFAELQRDVFTPSCAQAGCHGGARPAFGLDLSADVAFDNIVNVASAEDPSIDIVEPGNANASYIVRKLFKPWWDPHPPGQPRLSNAAMQRLRQWIDEGAQND
jgi:hypothetical protein